MKLIFKFDMQQKQYMSRGGIEDWVDILSIIIDFKFIKSL